VHRRRRAAEAAGLKSNDGSATLGRNASGRQRVSFRTRMPCAVATNVPPTRRVYRRRFHPHVADRHGCRVRKGEPVCRPDASVASVALPSFDETSGSRARRRCTGLGAIEKSVVNGTNVLLQIMDSSKLGWRRQATNVLDEIRRLARSVQVVVDAVKCAPARPRLKNYLDRGYIVIVTARVFSPGLPSAARAGTGRSLEGARAVTEVHPALRIL